MNFKHRIFFLIFFTSVFSKAFAQDVDYDWWVKIHNWVYPAKWDSYYTYSAAYFGPNALPVPIIQKGVVNNKFDFEFNGEAHFMKGDKTQNIFSRLNIPIVKNKVTIELSGVPVEHFETDTIIRDMRAARCRESKGISFGDLYFATIIQIFKNKKSIPDVSFRAAMRTASGTNFKNARFTDAPGYFFDFSFGKIIHTGETIDSLRLYSMLGFYCWQTNITNNMQDDSFLYGLGFDTYIKSWRIENYLAGYVGYLRNGDRPMVYRLNISKTFKKISVGAGYQLGIVDFRYKTYRTIFNYYF